MAMENKVREYAITKELFINKLKEKLNLLSRANVLLKHKGGLYPQVLQATFESPTRPDDSFVLISPILRAANREPLSFSYHSGRFVDAREEIKLLEFEPFAGYISKYKSYPSSQVVELDFGEQTITIRRPLYCLFHLRSDLYRARRNMNQNGIIFNYDFKSGLFTHQPNLKPERSGE